MADSTQYARYSGFSSGGVTSLNGLSGALTLVGTGGITITPSGSNITIDGSGIFTPGNLTDAGTDGITITNGTNAVNGSGTQISQHVADSTHNGYLSSIDWTTFNNKQPAGSYITALTGDVTATGPGSAAATLATVNSNVGTFASVTVNAKGLVTAATALSGDATTSGATLTLNTVNSNVGTFASVMVNDKGLVTAAANLSGDATTSGSTLTLATVNANTGSFGSSTAIPNFTVNGKGLITAAGTNAVIAPAGTLTGTTLAANVVNSSLTTVGLSSAGVVRSTAGGLLSSAELSGDVTTSGSNATTLATVNSNVGSFTYASITVNAKGLVTAASSGAAPFTNPMTTLGDIIYENATPAAARLPGNTTTIKEYLSQTGNGTISAAPAWAQVAFADLSGIASSTQVNTATFVAPTFQQFTAGTSQTYTLPTSPRKPLYIRVRMCGGGGGGAGGGGAGGTGGNGTASSFTGTSTLTANGGTGGVWNSPGGAGGTASFSTASGLALAGGTGGGGSLIITSGAGSLAGAQGGMTPYFCGGGVSQQYGGSTAGTAGAANTGGGGQGGGTATTGTNDLAGAGGGSGGFIEAVIFNPSTTYTYSVGGGGTGGTAGSNGNAGGNGGTGYVEVWEFYQ